MILGNGLLSFGCVLDSKNLVFALESLTISGRRCRGVCSAFAFAYDKIGPFGFDGLDHVVMVLDLTVGLKLQRVNIRDPQNRIDTLLRDARLFQQCFVSAILLRLGFLRLNVLFILREILFQRVILDLVRILSVGLFRCLLQIVTFLCDSRKLLRIRPQAERGILE